MAIDPFADCNIAIPTYECTLETCCREAGLIPRHRNYTDQYIVAQSFFLYLPNLGANLFFLIFFGVFIIPQLGLSIWKRTWGFGVGMFMGLVLEGVGYAARVMLHYQPFNNNWFLMSVLPRHAISKLVRPGLYFEAYSLELAVTADRDIPLVVSISSPRFH